MKWTHLVTKTFAHSDRRRPSQCSSQSDADTASVMTSESSVDRLFLALPSLFRRRCSNSSTSSIAASNDVDHEKIKELYALALDEVTYAEDSKGSAYYAGDVLAAREAIDDYANAFMQLLQQLQQHQQQPPQPTDALLHDQLQTSLMHKLIQLQSRYDALPPVVDLETAERGF